MAVYDDFIRGILQVVSKDYNIDFREMAEKYSLGVETVALSKMKKSDLVQECNSLGIDTDGSVVELKDRIKKSRKESGIKVARGSKKKKLVKKTNPVHNHTLCIEIKKDCPLCQSHGNVFCSREDEYEIV
jgi:hypothetical protein